MIQTTIGEANYILVNVGGKNELILARDDDDHDYETENRSWSLHPHLSHSNMLGGKPIFFVSSSKLVSEESNLRVEMNLLMLLPFTNLTSTAAKIKWPPNNFLF